MVRVETGAPAQWQQRTEIAFPPAIDKCPSNRIHSLSRMQLPYWPYSITKARCSGAIIPAIVG